MDKIESILPYFIWIKERDEDEIDEDEISFFLRYDMSLGCPK